MEEIKRIHFKRSGGFSGITAETSVNIALLPADEATMLKEMLYDSRISEFKPEIHSNAAADRFNYTITLESNRQRQVIELYESQINQKLRPLIEYLMNRARKK